MCIRIPASSNVPSWIILTCHWSLSVEQSAWKQSGLPISLWVDLFCKQRMFQYDKTSNTVERCMSHQAEMRLFANNYDLRHFNSNLMLMKLKALSIKKGCCGGPNGWVSLGELSWIGDWLCQRVRGQKKDKIQGKQKSSSQSRQDGFPSRPYWTKYKPVIWIQSRHGVPSVNAFTNNSKDVITWQESNLRWNCPVG